MSSLINLPQRLLAIFKITEEQKSHFLDINILKRQKKRIFHRLTMPYVFCVIDIFEDIFQD